MKGGSTRTCAPGRGHIQDMRIFVFLLAASMLQQPHNASRVRQCTSYQQVHACVHASTPASMQCGMMCSVRKIGADQKRLAPPSNVCGIWFGSMQVQADVTAGMDCVAVATLLHCGGMWCITASSMSVLFEEQRPCQRAPSVSMPARVDVPNSPAQRPCGGSGPDRLRPR